MSEHDFLGWDLDEVLEGPERMPAVYVNDSTNTITVLPALVGEERAAVVAEWRDADLREHRKVAEAVEALRVRGIIAGMERVLGPVASPRVNPRDSVNPLDYPSYQAHLVRYRENMVRRVREVMAKHAEQR